MRTTYTRRAFAYVHMKTLMLMQRIACFSMSVFYRWKIRTSGHTLTKGATAKDVFPDFAFVY